MKKKLLPLAMLAGLAGAAGTAQAVHLNPDGLGQVLIYPYFTVNGGNDTYISIVNTTNQAKAVKVRFLEGENSQEVLDFNLYLSPFDHWSGAITSNTGDTAVTSAGVVVGGAKLVTGDNSCTAPAIPAAGVPFRPFAYNGTFPDSTADTNTDITRTREGYVEIVEMGNLGFWDGDAMVEYEGGGDGQFGAAAAVKHSASGVPANCGLVRTAWNPGPNPAAGNWTLDATRNIIAPSGGLYGYAVVINVAEGTNAAYSAVAVDNFTNLAQNTNPGSLLPSLNSSLAFSDVFDAASVVSTDFAASIDALSSVFMRDTLSNDYVLDPGLAAETDWVVTFPTKRFYVQAADLEDRQPFSDRWNLTRACEHIEVTYWNREEGRPTVIEDEVGIDFSPRPPQLEDIPEGFNLCTEVNIITFNEGSVLGSTDRLTYNLNLAEGFVNGWAQIDFTQPVPPAGDAADYNDREISGLDIDAGVNTFTGLPVVGFAVQKYVNGNVGGLLSNYTGTVEHKYTRSIVNSL